MGINETPPPSVPTEAPLPQPQPPKRLGKKLYLIIGLIAVAAVASAFSIIYFLPRSEAATVSLGLNYSVGEKMTYEMTISLSVMEQSVTQTGTISMEVLSFDGENYTIRQAMEFQQLEFSYTVRMDKTGRIVDFSDLPPEFQQMYSSFIGMPGYGSYFQKEQVKVGEDWQIPLSMSFDDFSVTGTLNYVVSEIKDVTVPAGTYNAFMMNFTATNIQMSYAQQGLTINMVLSMNGYGYLEMGTCRPVDFNIQESVTSTSMSMSMTMQMQLIQHIK